jgi:hypothetical protein
VANSASFDDASSLTEAGLEVDDADFEHLAVALGSVAEQHRERLLRLDPRRRSATSET